ncbi:hypothetical protein QTP86_020568 [Hemibagrus guttatus]|nr:hypothetical protein QTP86_020568 [Hemibagrus guttatus]
MGEVRKLQKKLRQIENLELKVSLTPEEAVKVSKKAELRSRLAELLLQLSGPQQTQYIVGKEVDKMKRQVESKIEHHSDHTLPEKLARKDHQETEDKTKSGAEQEIKEREAGIQSQKLPDPDAEFSSLKALWEKAKFRLRTLKGHSDIITCVAAVDNLVISGSFMLYSFPSRDTTVKVWHVPTATEQRNLGGHSGGVTCLSTPPAEYCWKLASALHLSEKERFIISGSTDCCVRIWTLSSGQCVKSIYTFNAVTSLCFIAEWEGYIVTGSDTTANLQWSPGLDVVSVNECIEWNVYSYEFVSVNECIEWNVCIGCLRMSQQLFWGCVTDAGKLQVWDWLSQDNRQSVNVHLDAVTTLQSQGPLVFSGSTDGSVCVWEVCDGSAKPLNQIQHWGSEVTGCGRIDDVTGKLRLSARGDHIFLANGRSSIRVLNWRTGTMRRLTNHSSTAGVTDCVNQIPRLLVASCFDLTSGGNALNLFSLPECRYLVSLTSSDLSRIPCFAAWLTPSGGHRWVTGGRDLTVWEQLTGNGKKRGDVNARRDSRLDGLLAGSDGDSQEESDDDDDDDDDDDEDSTISDAEEVSRSSWLRCVLQQPMLFLTLTHSGSLPLPPSAASAAASFPPTAICLRSFSKCQEPSAPPSHRLPLSRDDRRSKKTVKREAMERCSISGLTALLRLLLVALLICPPSCHAGDDPADMQLSATAQATPTPLWAVDWGPTQPLEDETHHFLSGQEADGVKQATPEVWPRRKNAQSNQTQQQPLSIEAKDSGEEPERDAEEREIEEVDPQFYVTVTISSLLILSALIISAKLCYDRSLSQRPPPLSLAIPRSLAQEDSRHTLQSTPSFTDRERLPVVNL